MGILEVVLLIAGIVIFIGSFLLPSGKESGINKEAAKEVGALIAKRALEKNIKDVVFDRGGYIYHGVVKELAEAARNGGLNF